MNQVKRHNLQFIKTIPFRKGFLSNQYLSDYRANSINMPDLKTLWNLVEDYVRIRLQLLRLKAVEQVAKIMADVISSITLMLCMLMAFLAGWITLAFYLSELFQSFSKGFGCVTLFFTLVAFIVLWTKDRLEKQITNLMVKRYFDKHCEEGDKDEDC